MNSVMGARVALWTGAEENLGTVEKGLVEMGCSVHCVDSFEDLWRLVESDIDLVVVNCRSAAEILFWMNGVRRAGQTTPPVLTFATALDMEEYLHAMAMGAFDCVGLPVQDNELQRLVSRAMEHRQTEPLLLHS